MIVYAAKHLLPVASTPIQNGAVAVHEGRIVAVGRRKDVVKLHGSAEVRDLGDTVIIPGLVNAHTHLELSFMNGEPPAGGAFMTWLADLVTRRPGIDAGVAREAAAGAVASMVSRGTVAVGDVANDAWAAPLLARSGLFGIAFHELFGFRSADAESILASAAARLTAIDGDPDVAGARGRLLTILTPHAAHTTSNALLKALGGRAVASAEVLSIHVAESEEESQLLRDGTGPFKDFLIERGAWEPGWKAPGLTPVEYLDRLGVLTPRTLAVHCIHIDHQDLTRLQSRGVTVVTCPRSNVWVGAGPPPAARFYGAGVPVAIGTDSLASAPTLNLFDELAELHRIAPAVAPSRLLDSATRVGAEALRMGADFGTLAPGKRAAIVAVDVPPGVNDVEEYLVSGVQPDQIRWVENA
jgi:cytosine/adenosine deaminase-related metal-dependent hydrolase